MLKVRPPLMNILFGRVSFLVFVHSWQSSD